MFVFNVFSLSRELVQNKFINLICGYLWVLYHGMCGKPWMPLFLFLFVSVVTKSVKDNQCLWPTSWALAIIIADNPTPPHPKMATVSSGLSRPCWIMAR